MITNFVSESNKYSQLKYNKKSYWKQILLLRRMVTKFVNNSNRLKKHKIHNYQTQLAIVIVSNKLCYY